jgi:prephenate dehydrogenase
MSPNRQRITIIGTGCIGASIGLALRQSPDAERLEIVGHDRELGLARQAQKLGALDRVEFNLDMALRDARLVILAVPLASLREVLNDVGRLLEADAGVVLTDTTPLCAPAIQWADELLPPGNYFVSADPFLAPGTSGWEPLGSLLDARAALFSRATYAITARADDHPSAVQAVVNLALVLGAEPLFMNPIEHDAARVLSNAVPDIIAAALFQGIASAPGWAEVRKASARTFATATAGTEGDTASRRMLALLGRETVLRGLDAFQTQLDTLRKAVEVGDAEALDTTFANVSQARSLWMTEARERAWDIERGAIAEDSLFDRTLKALLGEGMTRKGPGPR